MFLSSLLRSRTGFAFSFFGQQNNYLYPRRLVPGPPIFRDWKLFGTSDNPNAPEPMANIYSEWALEDDRLLFANRKKSIPELASMFGRGLRGVESRLSKLTDVNSSAYARLFANGMTSEEDSASGKKLAPAKDVLTRIQWDSTLKESDFSILHYDRIEDDLVESPMDAPNNSVKGTERLLALAIPEHRIAAIKYKERIVWDKENRIDRIFGTMRGNGETIQDVLATYDEWKHQKDATEEWNRKRQAEVSSNIESLLGADRFAMLKQLSSTLLEDCEHVETTPKKEVETYVRSALQLFRDARTKSTSSSDQENLPLSDSESLDMFSELVALLPDSELRPAILTEITFQINRLEGKKVDTGTSTNYELPELNEADLVETFVRGSGAGGQKINKTSNCVVLLHEPTQLRVACQDTRSLQQNRKIARKRLRLKLDEYLNGSQSKVARKNDRIASKKQKAKARSRSRQKKKMETSQVEDS